LGIATIAVIRMSTVADHAEETIQELVEIEDVTYVAQVSGNYNILLLVATQDAQTLGNLCDNKLLAMRGVDKLNVQLLVANLKHEYHICYFEGQEDIPRRK
jgi:DNA-binding Lrp family transcriptional regulator